MSENNFRYIFWDFDGVILNSNEVRDEGFIQVLRSFPSVQVDALLDFHRKNGGLSRYVKFRHFYEQIRNEAVTDKRILELANEFSIIMKKLLTDKNLLIHDSLDFISNNYEKIPMHIVSGSDGNELRFLCKKLDISKYFQSIGGSPTPKKTLVYDALKKFNYNAGDGILIGDSINDYDAAKDNQIDFYGYNNVELKSLGCSYIESFKSF